MAVLARRTTLFVLDNSDRVAAEVVALIERVMQDVVQIRVLATSRRRLGKVYEKAITLETLQTPEVGMAPDVMGTVASVRLFLDRCASGEKQAAVPRQSAESVGRICRLLEGLPLALEVVAAGTTGRPMEQLADELEENLGLSMERGSSFDDLQRTISATIHWGLSQLSPEAQMVFARLSVFRGSFERADAETVCGFAPLMPEEVERSLAALADASLIVVEPTGHFRLLSVIREVASANLDEAGETTTTRDVHLRFFAALFDRTPDALAGPNQVAWSRRIDLEIDNIRAALQWGLLGAGNHDQATRLAASLETYWIRHALRSEGRTWLEVALTGATGLDRVNALIAIGRFAFESADYEAASMWLAEAVDLAGRVGTTARRAHAMGWLGVLEWYQGDYGSAVRRLTDALAISEKCGDRHGEALWHSALGVVASSKSDYAGARARHQAALSIAEHTGDGWIAATARGNLGDVAGLCGDVLTAETNMLRAIEITREIGDRSSEGHWVGNLGMVVMSRGDYIGASGSLEAGIAIAEEVGDRVRQAWWTSALAEVAAVQGHHEEATRLARLTLEVSYVAAFSRATALLAWLARQAGDLETADRESTLALAALNPDRWLLTTSLVLIGASRGGESAVLIGAALWAWNEESGSKIGLPHADWLRTALDDARALLGVEVYEALWEEGRRIPLDDVAAAVSDRPAR
jgi:predicted ATPase